MITQIEYALMAGGSYISNYALINQFPVPSGWQAIPNSYSNISNTGFEAISFQSQTNPNEIVISYAGTNPASIPDWVANVALWAGSDALQLQQAADYYLQVQALNPNATISFTGHSLGGGLASLMGVMFDKTAVTFDQAPFRNSATASVANYLLTYLQGEGYTANQLAQLNNFIHAAKAAPGTIPNEALVTDTNVQGEALSLLGSLSGRIGSLAQPDLTQQNDISLLSLPPVDLHSQALLAAFLQSDATANPNQTLNDATFKITDLLKMIFDGDLYAYSPNDSKHTNFLEDIVRHQTGVAATSATGVAETAIPADAMVTRFTDDLWKIAQPGGLTLSNNHLTDALVAYAMDKYYNEKTGTPGAGQELYNVGNGYIEFSTASITTNGSMGNGNRYLNPYLDSAYTSGNGYTQDAASLIRSLDNSLGDWYIQAGGSAMVATDSSNVGAFMLGGAGNDNLTGGLGNNLLVAGSGNDLLNGGAGNNVLIAGAGTDSLYGGQGNATLYGGSGNDTFIFDSTQTVATEMDANGNVYYKYGSLANIITDGSCSKAANEVEYKAIA